MSTREHQISDCRQCPLVLMKIGGPLSTPVKCDHPATKGRELLIESGVPSWCDLYEQPLVLKLKLPIVTRPIKTKIEPVPFRPMTWAELRRAKGFR